MGFKLYFANIFFNSVNLLIIKSGKKYLGVPLKHIEEDDKLLLVKGLVDKKNAEIMGELWRQESFKEIDHNEAYE